MRSTNSRSKYDETLRKNYRNYERVEYHGLPPYNLIATKFASSVSYSKNAINVK